MAPLCPRDKKTLCSEDGILCPLSPVALTFPALVYQAPADSGTNIFFSIMASFIEEESDGQRGWNLYQIPRNAGRQLWLALCLPRARCSNVRRPVQKAASWAQPGRCWEGPGNLHSQRSPSSHLVGLSQPMGPTHPRVLLAGAPSGEAACLLTPLLPQGPAGTTPRSPPLCLTSPRGRYIVQS